MKNIYVLTFLAISSFLFISDSANAQIQFKINGSTKWEFTERCLIPYQFNKGIFIGKNAGLVEDNSLKYSIAIGENTLQNNTISKYNIAIGFEALKNNGIGALSAINDGSYNVALGYRTGSANTIGDKNTFIGSLAGNANTIGRLNVAIGFASLYDNTTGSNNTAIGLALANNTVGNSNVGIGYNSLAANTSGNSNTAIGNNSLGMATTGNNNTGIGSQALISLTTGIENTAIGSYSGGTQNASYSTAVGYRALDLSLGQNNVAVGNWSLRNNTLGNRNVAIGVDALRDNTATADLVAIGYKALTSYSSNTLNNQHIAIGSESSRDLTSAYRTIAIGTQALLISNESDNQAVGHYALLNHNSGENNTAIGFDALRYPTANGARTVVGWRAGWNDAGNYLTSVCVGYYSSNTANYQVRLGNPATQNIGGNAPWTNTSDGRFKKNVTENVIGLDFINKLRPVTYNFDQHALEDFLPSFNDTTNQEKNDGWYGNEDIRMTGFIAQEVEEAANQVNYDFYGLSKPESENDYYGLRYAVFTVPLVKAVQELSQENKNLKISLQNGSQEIEALLVEMKNLRERFAQLENSLKDF